jgi:hypothetical protein
MWSYSGGAGGCGGAIVEGLDLLETHCCYTCTIAAATVANGAGLALLSSQHKFQKSIIAGVHITKTTIQIMPAVTDLVEGASLSPQAFS